MDGLSSISTHPSFIHPLGIVSELVYFRSANAAADIPKTRFQRFIITLHVVPSTSKPLWFDLDCTE
jgi:hypothetical protein